MKEIRTTYTREERQEVERLLLANSIEYRVVEDRKLHENAYTTNPTNNHYIIMVEDSVAPQALELLNEYYDAEDDADSILQQFEDEDLIEILVNHTNYSAKEVARATAILTTRGYTSEGIASRIRLKISADNQPQRASNWAITGGYAFAACGWVLGFAIGWFLYFAKTKHTVTGEVYYAHDEYSRKQGRNIFVFGTLFWIAIIAYFLKDI